MFLYTFNNKVASYHSLSIPVVISYQKGIGVIKQQINEKWEKHFIHIFLNKYLIFPSCDAWLSTTGILNIIHGSEQHE